jgi:hypothetical protein
MAKKQLVLAFFENEAAADAAADKLKSWDKATKDIKLGSIGVLVKDDKGKVKTHKLGSRRTGTGVTLGVLAAILSGGVTLLGGVVVGGIAGSLFHKGLGMSKDDVARISSNLDGGHAAVGTLVAADEAATVSAKLTELGGTAETHEVEEAAVEEAAAAVEGDAKKAGDDAEKAADDVVGDAKKAGDDAEKAADDVVGDAKKVADDAAGDAKKAADDVAGDAKKAADDVADDAKKL